MIGSVKKPSWLALAHLTAPLTNTATLGKSTDWMYLCQQRWCLVGTLSYSRTLWESSPYFSNIKGLILSRPFGTFQVMFIHPLFCIFLFFITLFSFHSVVIIVVILKPWLCCCYFEKEKKYVFLLGKVWFAWNLNELLWIAGDKVLRYSSLFKHMFEIFLYYSVSEEILSQTRWCLFY